MKLRSGLLAHCRTVPTDACSSAPRAQQPRPLSGEPAPGRCSLDELLLPRAAASGLPASAAAVSALARAAPAAAGASPQEAARAAAGDEVAHAAAARRRRPRDEQALEEAVALEVHPAPTRPVPAPGMRTVRPRQGMLSETFAAVQAARRAAAAGSPPRRLPRPDLDATAALARATADAADHALALLRTLERDVPRLRAQLDVGGLTAAAAALRQGEASWASLAAHVAEQRPALARARTLMFRVQEVAAQRAADAAAAAQELALQAAQEQRQRQQQQAQRLAARRRFYGFEDDDAMDLALAVYNARQAQARSRGQPFYSGWVCVTACERHLKPCDACGARVPPGDDFFGQDTGFVHLRQKLCYGCMGAHLFAALRTTDADALRYELVRLTAPPQPVHAGWAMPPPSHGYCYRV